MGRTSASFKAGGGSDSRAGRRPSNDHVYKRPSGPNADGAPTVRNVIPWRDMEKKLAERLAAKAAAGELSGELDKDELAVPSTRPPPPRRSEIEAAPDSGVRSSAEAPGPVRELTYSVYTIAELESRAQGRPPRMSMAFAPPVAQPSRWADAKKSGVVLLRALWSCVRAPKPRPRVMDVCRVPLVAFLTDVKLALRALPWKKLGTWTGIAIGSLVLLLFVVLTTAELTDDLKPARSSTSRPSAATVVETDQAVSPVEATASGAAAATALPTAARAAPTAEPAQIEIDEEGAPPPANSADVAKRAAPAKRPAPKKDVELFIP